MTVLLEFLAFKWIATTFLCLQKKLEVKSIFHDAVMTKRLFSPRERKRIQTQFTG